MFNEFEVLLKGRAEPLRGTILSVRLIESRHCVVSSMGFRLIAETHRYKIKTASERMNNNVVIPHVEP